jgi:thiamine kinase-like enzyme
MEQYDWIAYNLENITDNSDCYKGYYNHNYFIQHNGQKYVLRVPQTNCDIMDIRVIPEAEVLHFVNKSSIPSPRLIYSDPQEKFYLHGFIDGHLVNDLYYFHKPLPNYFPRILGKQMQVLHSLNISHDFPGYHHIIAKSPDTRGFYSYLINHVSNLYKGFRRQYNLMYNSFMFPSDPFAAVAEDLMQINPREFVLCHCDIHRKNLLTTQPLQFIILDWEMALIGDPFYDIAVHFHKMGYSQPQKELFVASYYNYKDTEFYEKFLNEIEIYVRLEQVKSAIVDSVRYSKDVLQDVNDDMQKQIDYAIRFQYKLNKAWQVWGVSEGNPVNNPIAILNILRQSTG